MDETGVVARMVNGLSHRSYPGDEVALQAVQDAGARLQVCRGEVAALVAAGSTGEAEIVGVGLRAANDWMAHESAQWREYHSTRTAGVVSQLRYSLPLNRLRVRGGARITTIYEASGLDANARVLVANEKLGTYRLGHVPMRLTVVDHRFVLLDGPVVDGRMTLMKVTSPVMLDLAQRYWDAVQAAVVPLSPGFAGPEALTPRQRQVVALLGSDLNDEAIAEALDVSVRTVRADVAAVLAALGVRSRFAAGARLQIWDRLELTSSSP